MTRKTYSTAARVTGSGALKLLGCWGEVPAEIDGRFAGQPIDGDLDANSGALIHFIIEPRIM